MSKPRLRLTTPSIRDWLLPAIAEDPELLSAPLYFDVRWQVLLDMANAPKAAYTPTLPWCWVCKPLYKRGDARNQPRGEDLYNAVLEEMEPDEWHFGFGDDSVPHPGVFKALRETIDQGPDVVVFPMHHDEVGLCEALPENMKPCAVSGGQVAFKRSAAGDLRWPVATMAGDGMFIEQLYERTGGRNWLFLKEPVLRFNQLKGVPRATVVG